MSVQQPQRRTGAPSTAMPSWTPPSGAKRTRFTPTRVVLLSCFSVVLIVTLWAAWDSYRLVRSAQAMNDAKDRVQAAMKREDPASLGKAVDELTEATGRARAAATSPTMVVWAEVPWLGEDMTAVRSTVIAMDQLATGTLKPLANVRSRISPDTIFKDGAVDIAGLSSVAGESRAAANNAKAVQQDIDAINVDNLTGLVRNKIRSATEGVRAVSSTSQAVALFAEQGPALLGANEPRTYLVAIQNLAESRPTGGLVGGWAALSIHQGKIEMSGRGTDNDLNQILPTEEVPAELRTMYGDKITMSQNYNLTPDFATAATLFSQLWVKQGNPAPDGVLAIDPVTLAAILKGTGPVTVEGGPEITADNAVRVLMKDVYVTMGGDSDVRRKYLSRVTDAVFKQLTAKPQGFTELTRLLREPGPPHVAMWAKAPAEQEALVAAGISGSLPTPRPDTAGVYVTNADASKLDYWRSTTVTVQGRCGPSPGSITAEISNKAQGRVPTYMGNQLGVTGDALKNLTPESTTDKTNHVMIVTLALPPSRGVATVSVNGQQTTIQVVQEKGWTMARLQLEVAAGKSATVTWQLTGDQGAPGNILTQPGIYRTDVAGGGQYCDSKP